MPMKPREWLLPAATGIAGLAAGLFFAGSANPPDVAGPEAPTPLGAAPASATPGRPLTAEDIRRVVREELAARSATPAGPAAAAAESKPSSAQLQSATQVTAALESAISRGSWTEADADAAREDFHSMTGDQQAEFLRQFAVAVNQGRLVPQGERVPF